MLSGCINGMGWGELRVSLPHHLPQKPLNILLHMHADVSVSISLNKFLKSSFKTMKIMFSMTQFWGKKLLLFYISNKAAWTCLFPHTLEMWIVVHLIGNKRPSWLFSLELLFAVCKESCPINGTESTVTTPCCLEFRVFLISPIINTGWMAFVLKGRVQGTVHLAIALVSWMCSLHAQHSALGEV